MDDYRDVLDQAQRMGREYLTDINLRRVAPDAAALAGLSAFDQPLPAAPGDPLATLELLNRAGGPATIASSGSRYFGFVTGGILPAAAGAHWLAGAWDQLAFNETSSPAAIKVEAVAEMEADAAKGAEAAEAAKALDPAAAAAEPVYRVIFRRTPPLPLHDGDPRPPPLSDTRPLPDKALAAAMSSVPPLIVVPPL